MGTKNLVDYLIMVSNNNLFLNFGMHLLVLFAIVAVFILKDVKVRKYILEGTFLAVFISVTIHGIIFGNPFHAITFGLMAIIAGFVLIKSKNIIELPSMNIKTIISVVFILLGLWYPELVKTNMVESLLLSPVGIVPCPTLITLLGMMNLFYSGENKKYFAVVIFFGFVYGMIGTFKLGVYFDICLLVVAVFSVLILVTDKQFKSKKSVKEVSE